VVESVNHGKTLVLVNGSVVLQRGGVLHLFVRDRNATGVCDWDKSLDVNG